MAPKHYSFFRLIPGQVICTLSTLRYRVLISLARLTNKISYDTMIKIRENKTCHSTRQLLQRKSINFRFFCLQYMWLRIGSLHEYPIPQNKARIGSIPIPGIGTRSFLTFLLDRTEACLRGSSSMTSSYHKMAPNQSITIRQGFATILWQLVAFFKKSTKVVKWQGFFFFF